MFRRNGRASPATEASHAPAWLIQASVLAWVGAWAAIGTGAAPAEAGTSTATNPEVVFDSAGSKSVTLRVCREDLCDEVTRFVEVLDPRPQVLTSLAASGATAETGHLVLLRGTASGRPPLQFEWEIARGVDVIARLAGADVAWDTAGAIPGAYSASLRVSNASGEDYGAAVPVTLLENRALAFQPIEPCRIYDSRNLLAILAHDPIEHGEIRRVAIAGRCGIPAAARSVAANVTVTGASGAGSVAVLPGNYPVLAVPVTQFQAGQTRANMAVLMLATDGVGDLFVTAEVPPAGAVDVILDVTGYWLPAD